MNPLETVKIETSADDTRRLSEFGLTAQEISEKICWSIKKAKEIFSDTQRRGVFLDNQILVSNCRN